MAVVPIDEGYAITPLSGKDGASGTGITVQYSVNGSTDWHSTFTNGDVYMRQSTDGGTTWSEAIKIVGEDGTSTRYSSASATSSTTSIALSTVTDGTAIVGDLIIAGSLLFTVTAVNSTTATVSFVQNLKGNDNKSITVILSAPNVDVSCDSSGTPTSLVLTETYIRVYQNTQELSYNGTGTSDGTWKVTVSNASGCTTPTNFQDMGVYARAYPLTKLSNDQASRTFTVTGKRTDGTTFEVTVTQGFSKTKQGPAGNDGVSSYSYVMFSANADGTGFSPTPSATTQYVGFYSGTSATAPSDKTAYTWSKYVGPEGASAKFVEIEAPNGLVWQTGQEDIVLNCVCTGFTPTSYKWYHNGGLISSATTSSFSPWFPGVYKVLVNNTYSDYVNVINVKDGIDGTSPYACSVSNENFSIATDYDLKPVETKNYDIEFTAYKGNARLTAVASNPTTGQFSISQPTGLTKQTDHKTLRFSASTGTAIPANASYEVTVYYEGTSVTETKVITVSSAKSGNGIALRFSQSPLPDDEYLELSDGTDLELHNGQGLLIEAGNKDGWHYPFAEGDLYMQTWSDEEGSWSEASKLVNKGIESMTRMYLATSLGTGVTRDTEGWTETTQTVTPTLKYLWTYDIIEYTDGSVDYTEPCISGTYGETGTKTFFSDVSRTWTDSNWNTYKAAGYTGSWSNSTVDGMRVGDVLVISATLSEQGNITGTVYAQITSVPSSKTGSYYEISCTTLYGMVGQRGQQGQPGADGIDGYSLQVSQDFIEFPRKLNGNINEAVSTFTVMLYKGALRETGLRYTDVSATKDSAWGNELTVSVSENASPADGTVKITVSAVANQNKALKDGKLTVSVTYGGSTYMKTIPVTTAYNGRYLGKATSLNGTSVTIISDSGTTSSVTAKIGDTVVWQPASTQSYTQGLCYELQTYDNSGTVAYSWADVQGNAEAYSTAFGDIMKLTTDDSNPAMIMAKNLATNMAFIGSLFVNQITMMKDGNKGGLIKSNNFDGVINNNTGEITNDGTQGWGIDYNGNSFFHNSTIKNSYLETLTMKDPYIPGVTCHMEDDSASSFDIDMSSITYNNLKTMLDNMIDSTSSYEFIDYDDFTAKRVYTNIIPLDKKKVLEYSYCGSFVERYTLKYTDSSFADIEEIHYNIGTMLENGSDVRNLIKGTSIVRFPSGLQSSWAMKLRFMTTAVGVVVNAFKGIRAPYSMTPLGHILVNEAQTYNKWNSAEGSISLKTKAGMFQRLRAASYAGNELKSCVIHINDTYYPAVLKRANDTFTLYYNNTSITIGKGDTSSINFTVFF